MSQDTQVILAGLFILCLGFYSFYVSRNKKTLEKMSENIMKSDNFFTRHYNYSEQYFRLSYVWSGYFCFLVGCLVLFTRTSFSHTTIGDYFVKTLIFLIFGSAIAVIIYSSWRFVKK